MLGNLRRRFSSDKTVYGASKQQPIYVGRLVEAVAFIFRDQFGSCFFPFSYLRSRTDSQRQKWHLRPLRNGTSWQSEKADADHAPRTESGVAGEILFVSPK